MMHRVELEIAWRNRFIGTKIAAAGLGSAQPASSRKSYRLW